MGEALVLVLTLDMEPSVWSGEIATHQPPLKLPLRVLVLIGMFIRVLSSGLPFYMVPLVEILCGMVLMTSKFRSMLGHHMMLTLDGMTRMEKLNLGAFMLLHQIRLSRSITS